MSILTITVSSPAYQFKSADETDLKQLLRENDSHTLVQPIMSATNDLCLHPETGKTNNGYAYSDSAFMQICTLVATGLSQIVLELSGQWRVSGTDKRQYSAELAIDVFNKALKLRFDKNLVGFQLVKNTKDKIIDGIVSSRYRYLSNSDFNERIKHLMHGNGSEFHSAYLYGRHLVVRHVAKNNGAMIADELYNYGYHFGNSEIGGKSVKAAHVIVRHSTGDCALGPFTDNEGGRVVHSGRDFEKRLHGLFENVVRRVPKISYEEAGRRLEARVLQLGGSDNQRRLKQLGSMLVRRKLTLSFVNRVLSSTALRGRDITNKLLDVSEYDRDKILPERTAYDLFTALIREADNLPLEQRETAEQVAYLLLSGKLII